MTINIPCSLRNKKTNIEHPVSKLNLLISTLSPSTVVDQEFLCLFIEERDTEPKNKNLKTSVKRDTLFKKKLFITLKENKRQ